MQPDDRISRALLLLRLSVFLVMLMWTMDKLLNPAHAAQVYTYFYGFGGLGPGVFYAIGAAELLLILGFQALQWGILADLIASNRKLLEDLLYRVRRMELGDRDRG